GAVQRGAMIRCRGLDHPVAPHAAGREDHDRDRQANRRQSAHRSLLRRVNGSGDRISVYRAATVAANNLAWASDTTPGWAAVGRATAPGRRRTGRSPRPRGRLKANGGWSPVLPLAVVPSVVPAEAGNRRIRKDRPLSACRAFA